MIDWIGKLRLASYQHRTAKPSKPAAAAAPASSSVFGAERYVPAASRAAGAAADIAELQALLAEAESRIAKLEAQLAELRAKVNANPYANVPLPDRSQMSDEDFVTDLYHRILNREPDAKGLQDHLNGLKSGADRHDLYKAFMECPELQERLAKPWQPPAKEEPAPSAPAAPAAPEPPPPISIDVVKGFAREYVAQHPEIQEAESYENEAAVAQLREGVIAMLNAKGYKAGRILGPDGKPYPQMIAFGNANDTQAQAYRVTAGGGPIRRAIEVGYCNDPIPMGDVR
jgi:hypothetical protein